MYCQEFNSCATTANNMNHNMSRSLYSQVQAWWEQLITGHVHHICTTKAKTFLHSPIQQSYPNIFSSNTVRRWRLCILTLLLCPLDLHVRWPHNPSFYVWLKPNQCTAKNKVLIFNASSVNEETQQKLLPNCQQNGCDASEAIHLTVCDTELKPI